MMLVERQAFVLCVLVLAKVKMGGIGENTGGYKVVLYDTQRRKGTKEEEKTPCFYL